MHCHVLVVDDDAPIRELVRMALEDAGFTVHEAADGQVALDLLRGGQSPCVVLVDGLMPRLSGLELLEIIARDAALASQHAYVLVTGSSEIAVPLAGWEPSSMPVRLLAKPFDLQALIEVVVSAAESLPQM